MNLDHDESKVKILENVAALKQQDADAHQRYIEEKAKYEEARTHAEKMQGICKRVMRVGQRKRAFVRRESLQADHVRRSYPLT